MITLLSVILSSVLLHPSQESLAELQFNEKTQRVEISLRLSIADEQQLLRGVSQIPLDELVQTPDAMQAAAVGVLARRLRLGTKEELDSISKPATDRTPYLWAGRQSEGAHVWWFFEVSGTPDRLTHLRCTLFKTPVRSSEITSSANAHNHTHAVPISTFVVLPRTTDDPTAEPKSFTTTNEHPLAPVQW